MWQAEPAAAACLSSAAKAYLIVVRHASNTCSPQEKVCSMQVIVNAPCQPMYCMLEHNGSSGSGPGNKHDHYTPICNVIRGTCSN